MQVTNSGRIQQATASAPVDAARPTSGQADAAVDRVTMPGLVRLVLAVKAAQAAASASRKARVAELQRAVRNGLYRLSPQHIARSMLLDLEESAGVAALMPEQAAAVEGARPSTP